MLFNQLMMLWLTHQEDAPQGFPLRLGSLRMGWRYWGGGTRNLQAWRRKPSRAVLPEAPAGQRGWGKEEPSASQFWGPQKVPHTCSEMQGAENPDADTRLGSGVSESATDPAQPLLVWVTLGKH